MGIWGDIGRGLLNTGKQIPVVGNILEGVAPTQAPKYDFGSDEYYAPQGRAFELYNQNMNRADREYRPGEISDFGPIRDVDIGPAERTRALDTGPARTYQSERITRPQDVQVGGLANVQTPEALRAEAAPTGTATGAGRIFFDQRQANQARGIQNEAVGFARETATTGGPGAKLAGLAYDEALDDADQRALGFAASAPVAEQASLRRKALFDRGRRIGEAARTKAQLTLQAQQSGQQALGALGGQVRGQDLSAAETQSNLDAQVETLNARLQTEMAAGNRDTAAALQRQLNDLEAKRREFGARSINERAIDEATLRTNVAGRNADRTVDVDVRNAELGTDAAKYGAEAENRRLGEYADRYDTAERTSADRGVDVRSKNADLTRDADIERARGKLDVETTRDVAGRGAFTATQNAQQGYLDSAGRAVNTELDATEGRTSTRAAEQGATNDETERRRKSNAANREGIRKVAEMYIQSGKEAGEKAGGGGGGAGAAAAAAARGGLVTKPQRLLVGERGPELIVPVKPSAANAYRSSLDLAMEPFMPSDSGGGLDDDELEMLSVMAERSRRKREARK